jgi:2-dehydro-3-deoxygalactonokinase
MRKGANGGAAGADWIAVDWGTSRLRAWAMRGPEPVAEAESDRGMAKLDPDGFEPALLALIEPWLGRHRLPVLACGMVGARQGWTEAPYRAVPCAPLGAPVAAPAHDERIDVRILPGLSQQRPPDVMRGEETQIAGFLRGRRGFDGVICLPGTHTKWVQVSAGEVVSFATAMTGEVFALMSRQSVLRHAVGGRGWDGDVFAEALGTALSRPERVMTGLFGIRAAGLLEGLDPGAARARLSGLLVGAELAAVRAYWLGQAVAVIGAPALAAVYADALGLQGVAAEIDDAEAATLAGLALAQEMTE